jgi:hypothetical protein
MRTEVVVNTRPIELTAQAVAHTLNKETNIFMPDGAHTEGQVKPITRAAEVGASVLPQAQTSELMAGLTPSQQRDAGRVLQMLGERGIAPEKVTSKSKKEFTAGEVVANSLIDSPAPEKAKKYKELLAKEDLSDQESDELLSSHKDHIAKQEEVLGRELTAKEKLGVLRAHYSNYGEKGKDGEASGVFNVTPEQLARKARILKEAGLDKEERREIIESGLAAAAPPALSPRVVRNQAIADLAGIALTGPLATIRDRIVAAHTIAGGVGGDGISSDELHRLFEAYQALINRTLGTKNTPQEQYEFSTQMKRIFDAEEVFKKERGPQDNFMKDYDFYINELRGMAPNDPQRPLIEARVRDLMMDFVGKINPSEQGIHDEVLRRIIQSDFYISPNISQEALDRLVIRIVGNPLQSETGDFDIGFYGGINLQSIKNLLQTMSQNPSFYGDPSDPNTTVLFNQFRDVRRAQMLDVINVHEGFRVVHEINKMISINQLDGANQFAPNLIPSYLQRLSKIKGVGTLFRLLESGHFQLMAKDGYLSAQNYRKMMGTTQGKEDGRIERSQDESIVGEVRQMIGSLLILNPNQPDLQAIMRMENWEIDLAFNMGRNLYNVLHRSIEVSSWGRIPKGMKAIAATVFGGFRNIFNPANYVLERFKPGENRGGYHLFQMFMDSMQRRREAWENYGSMNLDKIKGDEVRIFELPTIAGVRGYMSSWKVNEGLLKQVAFNYEPRGSFASFNILSQYELETTNSMIFDRNNGQAEGAGIGYFLDTGALTFVDPWGRRLSWGDLTDQQHADYFRSIFFKPGTGENGVEAQLRDDLFIGLGTIYKTSLAPSGGHHGHEKDPELNHLKEQIRELIWKREAIENPLAILPYIHRLDYSDRIVDEYRKKRAHAGVYQSDGRLEYVNGQWRGRKNILENIYATPEWGSFQRKMLLLNELRISKIKGGQLDYSLSDAIRDTDQALGVQRDANGNIIQGGDARINLTRGEIEIYERIKQEGMLAAGDMANVRFAFIPFANDLRLEDADFDNPGSNSYQRHFGDIVQINSSTGAMTEAFDNLGEVKDIHGVLEIVKKFEKGITAVHGDAYAKDKAAPFVEAITRFFRRGENAGGKKKFQPESKRTLGARFERYLRQWDEVHALLQGFKKSNSIAQDWYNVEVLAMDRHQTFVLMEDLTANGFMGHDQEEEYKENFGGFLGFIQRMILEGITRTLKIGGFIAVRSLITSSFKGAVK